MRSINSRRTAASSSCISVYFFTAATNAKLQDKEVEVLSDLERIQRRNELDRQMLEKMKKAAEENGDQE